MTIRRVSLLPVCAALLAVACTDASLPDGEHAPADDHGAAALQQAHESGTTVDDSLRSPIAALAAAPADASVTSDGAPTLRAPGFQASLRTKDFAIEPVGSDVSWSWTLASVRPGASGERLRVEPVGEPAWAVWRGGRSLERVWRVPVADTAPQRGEGRLVERYVDRGDHVEQQFELAAPLPLNGADLVIDGVIDVDGVTRFEATATGWRWHDGDGDGVRLGDVTVIDARGIALPATMDVDRDGTRVVVDGRALERAAYPVLIDPEIGPNDLLLSTSDADAATDPSNPAVAWSPALARYLVVWHGDVAVDGENEVYGRLVSPDGIVDGPDVRLTNQGVDGDTTVDAEFPDVVWNATDNQWLVVWSGDVVAGETEVFGQPFEADLTPVGSPIRLSSLGPLGNVNHDVSESAIAWNATDNQYFLVYAGDDIDGKSEVWGQRLANDLSFVGGGKFLVGTSGPAADTAFDATRPDVAWHANFNQYYVVWGADTAVDGENEIFGQLMLADGTFLLPNVQITTMGTDGDTATDAFDASVAWNATDDVYGVVWAGDDLASEGEIFAQAVGSNALQTGADDVQLTTTGATGDTLLTARAPEIAHDPVNNRYLVAWLADPVTNNENEVYLGVFDAAFGVQTAPAAVSDVGPAGDATRDAVSVALAAGVAGDEVMVTWDADDSDAGLADDEYEVFVQAWATTVPNDADSDGVRDLLDACPGSDDLLDDDADTVPNGCDQCPGEDDLLDTDDDTTPDCLDGCETDPDKTEPGQCGCGTADTDTDSDGTADCIDGCPMDADKIEAGVCGCGVADTDTDSDGAADCIDACPMDADKTEVGACGCGVADTDTDSDGTADCNDACPMDADKIAIGVCGCGVADTDTDTDGTADCNDACPMDADKVAAGMCGCGTADTDTDADGTADCNDECPMDGDKTMAGTCGCGVADDDTDSDGTADCDDECPMDAMKTAVGMCGCGVAEIDSDGDGVCDASDVCEGATDATDTDMDGVPDACDVCPDVVDADQLDADEDGVGDACDACPDTAADEVDGCPPSDDPGEDTGESDVTIGDDAMEGGPDTTSGAGDDGCCTTVQANDRSPTPWAPLAVVLVGLALLHRRRRA